MLFCDGIELKTFAVNCVKTKRMRRKNRVRNRQRWPWMNENNCEMLTRRRHRTPFSNNVDLCSFDFLLCLIYSYSVSACVHVDVGECACECVCHQMREFHSKWAIFLAMRISTVQIFDDKTAQIFKQFLAWHRRLSHIIVECAQRALQWNYVKPSPYFRLHEMETEEIRGRARDGKIVKKRV